MAAKGFSAALLMVFLTLTLVPSCAEPPPPPPVVYEPPPPPPPPPPPTYYVTTTNLALRGGPSMTAPIISVFSFNDPVEVYETIPSGWARVRDLRRGVEGWASMRYLQSYPASHPVPAARKRRAPAPKEEAPEPEKEKPAPPPPKAM